MPLLWVSIAIVVIAIAIAVGKVQAKAKAKKAYKDSLRKLKQDPNNPDLRERTLQLGRHYSQMMRDSKGHTLFDEVALMNDINAACARATVGQNAVGKVEVTNPLAVSGKSAAQEIEKLGQLFLAGVITAEEFERGKTLFLGAPPDKAATAVELLQNLDALKKKGVLSESEFNAKKWEILSERLIPGRLKAARLQPQTSSPHSVPAPVEKQVRVECPTCAKLMMIPSASSGFRYSCPHCKQAIEFE
ncbi:MAG: SHOCT domain-containing protein [Lentisphaerae bacterium]|nr:SHOCT domain-containing protein [Lentisphaerota bacterium]